MPEMILKIGIRSSQIISASLSEDRAYLVLKADMKSYIPLEMAAIFFLANLFLKQDISSEYVMVDFTWPVRSANQKLQNEKFLPTVGFEPRTLRIRSERAKRWAIRADKYWTPKGDCVLPELFM